MSSRQLSGVEESGRGSGPGPDESSDSGSDFYFPLGRARVEEQTEARHERWERRRRGELEAPARLAPSPTRGGRGGRNPSAGLAKQPPVGCPGNPSSGGGTVGDCGAGTSGGGTVPNLPSGQRRAAARGRPPARGEQSVRNGRTIGRRNRIGQQKKSTNQGAATHWFPSCKL